MYTRSYSSACFTLEKEYSLMWLWACCDLWGFNPDTHSHLTCCPYSWFVHARHAVCLVFFFVLPGGKLGPGIALGNVSWGFPGGTSCKEPARQCRRCKRHGFSPWAGKIPWRRKWPPTPVFLPGESHGQRSLEGCSPRGRREVDRTEAAEHTRNISVNHNISLSWSVPSVFLCLLWQTILNIQVTPQTLLIAFSVLFHFYTCLIFLLSP